MPVRLHPEATADPASLRWVTDTSTLGEPTPAMTELLTDGTLADMQIGTGEIRTRIGPGRTWAADGPRVRSVLFQSLSEAGPSEPIDVRVGAVVAREVAPFVRSHGGEIRVVSVADGVLTVALGGTCGHCALRTNTMRNVVENAVIARFPQIRKVRAVQG